ncbi:DsbA family protein [Hydrogenophaga borbori]|uniref:DsbA family protein n=1 Tax=Hydrogenophaga sp. PBC TaxID=795665 RepID=UPI0002607BE3|nr:thioredoxin domain-containing protein [Hydrogenophaga sp. PBC]AOS78022.1 disulfide bond formation protein DsbA [Hydrogenophaga sp. PBC]
MKQRFIVSLLALVALVVFAAAVFLYQRHTQQVAALQASEQAGAMIRSHSPVIGAADAPVTIVEFFDPACEACKAFHPQVKKILAAFPRETRLVIRYTPFHRESSVEAVRILEAARAQGMFEPMLETLLNGQRAWTGQGARVIDRAWAIAQSAGLDVERARKHIATGSVDALLAQDVVDLKAIGVRATPTFFVNGKPLSSTDPGQLHKLVRSEVERVRKAL